MPLTAGQALPDVALAAVTTDGTEEMSIDALFGDKTVVLFAVPGAFTPTCDQNHLPGYIEHADEILSKGVDQIAVVSVNDVHVMKAWKAASDPSDKVLFLSDGSANFTKAADMVLDGTGFGLGIRSLRYAALVKNGVVETMLEGDVPGQATESGAQAMLAILNSQ